MPARSSPATRSSPTRDCPPLARQTFAPRSWKCTGLSAQTEVDGYLRTLIRSPTLTHYKSPTQPDNTTGAVS